MNPPFLRRIVIRNYKSVALCDAALQRLTFLVGPTGSGKSNFLDALRFVSDAVKTTLDHAIRQRGGINEVRRRSGGHPHHLSVRLEFTLPEGGQGHYAFCIGARPRSTWVIQNEACLIEARPDPFSRAYYRIDGGRVVDSSSEALPPVAVNRLYLTEAPVREEFLPLVGALARMGFYSLNPQLIGDLQRADRGLLLKYDGSNAAGVFSRLSPEHSRCVMRYLSKIIPDLQEVQPVLIGGRETLQFTQSVKGETHPWRFLAGSMSDGALRALGIFIALFQKIPENGAPIPLTGLEEPTMGLHRGGGAIVLEALRDASAERQIIATGHRADLLDDQRTDTGSLLAVECVDGKTSVSALNEGERATLRERLHRPNDLTGADRTASEREGSNPAARRSQLPLFETRK